MLCALLFCSPSFWQQVFQHLAASQLCNTDLLSGAHQDLQDAAEQEEDGDLDPQEQIHGGAGETGLCCITGWCFTQCCPSYLIY